MYAAPQPVMQYPPARRRPWRERVISAVAGACLVCAAWTTTELVAAFSGPDTFTLHGTMTLTDYQGVISTTSGGCSGDGGYADIAEGTAVTVYDAAGQVLAVGHLHDSEQDPLGCTFQIKVPDVPEGQKFYRVEVSHRGKVTFSAMQAMTGRVAVSLG